MFTTVSLNWFVRLCAPKIFQHYVHLGQSSPHAADLKWSPFKSHQSLERGCEKGQASWAEVDFVLHPLLSAQPRAGTHMPGSCQRRGTCGTMPRWQCWRGCPKRAEKFARGRVGKAPGRKLPEGLCSVRQFCHCSWKELCEKGGSEYFRAFPSVVFIHPGLDINLCLIDQKTTDPQYVNMILISSLQVTHWFSAHCLLELWSSLFFEENIKERGAGGVLVTAINFTVHWKPH